MNRQGNWIGPVVVLGLAGSLILVVQVGHRLGAQEPPEVPPLPFDLPEGDHRLGDLFKLREPFDPDALVEGLESPRVRAEARLKLAEEMIEATMDRALMPPRAGQAPRDFVQWFDDFLLWRGRRLDARLELAEGKQERIAAIAEEIQELDRLGDVFGQLGPSRTFTRMEAAELEFRRLKLESMLADLVAQE
ncbi:hypothetical protein BH23PLA1_BH23PLA1_31530 [soil metagenome]